MNNERSTKISQHLDPEGYYRVEVRGYGIVWPFEILIQPRKTLGFTAAGHFEATFEVILKGEYINELEFEHRVIERVEREEN